MARVVITDNHMHVNPIRGLGPRQVAKRFLKAGGSRAVVVCLLSWSYGIELRDVSDAEKMYRLTISCVKEMREEGLEAYAVLGLHPAEFVKLSEKVGFEKAYSIVLSAYKLAGAFVKRGEAVGLGEAGTPHWEVSDAVFSWSVKLFEAIVSIAAELNCVVHVHTRRDWSTVRMLAEVCRRVGLPLHKVIIHHSLPDIENCVDVGVTPSVPAKSRELSEAVKRPPKFLVESDYLDDPRRPGAVVAPWALARNILRLIERGVVSEDYVEEICDRLFRRVYEVW